jgi:tRNA A37 threonylcarbamoyladenosine dehydratase
MSTPSVIADQTESVDRRFSGIARLYSPSFSHWLLQESHVTVVGLGGVGSWAVEALARFGVAQLTLIDLDHVAESNTNRQIQALDGEYGKAKSIALSERVKKINPNCHVTVIEDWVDQDNVETLIPACSAVLDCTDQVSAKSAMAAHLSTLNIPLWMSGAAGGKKDPTQVQLKPLYKSSHDPLLAKVRYQLRKAYAGKGLQAEDKIFTVFSTEEVHYPTLLDEADTCEQNADLTQLTLARQGLNCAGFGSSVLVVGNFAFTMVYGLLAYLEKLNQLSSTEPSK